MFKLIVSIIILLSLNISDASAEGRPLQSAAENFYTMLLNQKFKDLDQIAIESNKKNILLSDGQPELDALFAGISGCSFCGINYSEPEWKKIHELLTIWLRQNPKSTTAEIGLANFFINYGWSIRGNEYANKVKTDAWPVFYQNIEMSRNILEKASSASKDNPGWYQAMLTVGIAEGWPKENFDAIYREGIKKYPYYLPLYFAGAQFFTPKWHGSKFEFDQFVNSVIINTSPKLGNAMYARLHWANWNNDMFLNGQTYWSIMKRSFERIIADYPDPWNINNFAKFACLAQDWNTVTILAKKIGANPIEAAWGDSKDYYEQCVNYAQSITKH